MFTQILFVILVLLLISFAPAGPIEDGASSPLFILGAGMGAFIFILGLIALQNYTFRRLIRHHREKLLISSNLYLLTVLAFYHFYLKGQHLLLPSAFLVAAFSLSLYWCGLYVFHATAYPYLPASLRGAVASPSKYAVLQIRLVLPFVLPYLLFSLLLDLAQSIPGMDVQTMSERQGVFLLMGIAACFLILILLFFPPVVQALWNCKPLKDKKLLSEMELLCQKAGFKHAGIKNWTILNHAYSAGIIGILPRFRYIMFTQRLLDDLPKEACLAILAHEIGHSYRKHLLFYPFIIMGMIVATGLFTMLCGETIYTLFGTMPTLYPFIVFFYYAAIMALYFRFVFGYFSRLFEREADLHVYVLGIPPAQMQMALDAIGHASGGTHLNPCWHHHGIQKRIDFLEKTKTKPQLIARHHRFVKANLLIYGIVLLLATLALLSPLFEDIPPLALLSQWMENTGKIIKETLTP